MQDTTAPATVIDLTGEDSPPPSTPITKVSSGGPIQGGPSRRSRAGDRVRRFVFTLNNWLQEEWEYLIRRFAPQTTWMVVGKEIGSNGTPHLQGACILGSQMTFSRLKTLIGFKRAHIEVMMGSPEDSLLYCTKQDSDAFVYGTLPTQGKRTDLRVAASAILGGQTVRQLAQNEEGAVAVVKFYKGLTVLRSLTQQPRTAKPLVVWTHGSTGVGKTRCVFKAARALCTGAGRPADDIWISSGGLRWFDGYDGQLVAIFDDFRAKHVSSFAFFLRLLDRYPVDVEFKGGFVKFVPKYIFITCPYDPDECFSTRKEHVPEDIAQLNRRIDKVYEFERGLTKDERREFVESVLSLVPGED